MTIRLPITLALAALAFAFPVSADALAANVVPNPGFEQGGCGANTPIVCGWQPTAGFISQVGSPGSYSMSLDCGPLGCYGNEYGASLWARTAPAFCAAIGPGAHPASFVGGTSGDTVHLSAYFYSGADCTGPVGSDDLGANAPYATLVTGVLAAPPGTQSALFSVAAYTSSDCSDYCGFGATFDDLDVEDTVLPIPTIASFAPTGGLVGASVDIRGWNLTGATSVTFSGTSASFTIDSNSEIHTIVPAGAISGPISVTTPNGTATSPSSFTVSASSAPAISSFTPGGGPVGTSVDIKGWNLTGATSVAFSNDLGGFVSASFTVDSDSEIHATVPCGTSTGPIRVTTPNGTATVHDFYGHDAPTIGSFTPSTGPVGTGVTIAGAHLCSVSAVTFNGTAASFTVDSDSQIHATVPSGATTGPIEVIDAGGATATSSTSFTVITDTTPPDTTITSGPPATTTSSSAMFQFAATEPSTFQCRLDAAAFAACSSPATYTGLNPGSHTFQVRATDTAGNTDPTPAQQTWTVHANTPPTARLAFSCNGLTCHFDGTGSSDADGTITGYAWAFGDSTTAVGSAADHTYASGAGYPVTLTVTDNDGATATQSMTVTPISLAARGYTAKTLERVDLSWTGPSGAKFDVYRNGSRIAAAIKATSYTDNLNTKGSGTYTYKVCAAAFASCSDPATVSFSAAAAVSRAADSTRRRAHSRRHRHKQFWTARR